MINLLSPNIPGLLAKWGHVVASVRGINKFDTEGEIAWLCEAASRTDSAIECGSYVGVSTKAMLTANPKLSIICLDTWDDAGAREQFNENLKDEIAAGRVIAIQGTTDTGFKTLAEKVPNFSPQFAFIDASHLWPDVKHDIDNCKKIMKSGFISGHDYRHDLPDDGVTRSVRESFDAVSLPIDSIWAVEL